MRRAAAGADRRVFARIQITLPCQSRFFLACQSHFFRARNSSAQLRAALFARPEASPGLTQRPLFVYIDGAKTTSLVVYLSDKTELPQSCKKKVCSIFLNFGSINVN